MSAIPPRPRLEPPAFAGENTNPGWLRLRLDGGPLVLFTTRRGGFSASPFDSLNLGRSTGDNAATVERNRTHLLRTLELSAVATADQVHGGSLLEVTRSGPAGEGDALATADPEVALAISTADCLGVAVWNDSATGISVAHAGWRGVLAGAVDAAAEWVALRNGGTPGLRAAIGPGIRACCFEVGPEVAEQFPVDCVIEDSPRPRLDLGHAVRRRLAENGVAPERIFDLEMCTVCDAERFYSHRRDRGRTGRLWTLARIHPGRVG